MFRKRSPWRAAVALTTCGGMVMGALFATDGAAATQRTGPDAAAVAAIARDRCW
ncbi:hypothetical protein AB0I69_36565 [Streptomyces sp. NPDC050508]|uniref:hypothetical protein n=1 Tax=Streptomyces sp. NPDC050508 TaxID=3155405 RepID=UPI00341CC46C